MSKAFVCLKPNVSSSAELKGFNVERVVNTLSAKVMGAPLENGQISFDNKVTQPYEVVVYGTIVIDDNWQYEDTLEKIDEMLTNKDFKFYSVTDGASFYENLTLVECPIERDVSRYDWISVQMKFSHVMLVQGGERKAFNSDNSKTVNTGYGNGVLR